MQNQTAAAWQIDGWAHEVEPGAAEPSQLQEAVAEEIEMVMQSRATRRESGERTARWRGRRKRKWRWTMRPRRSPIMMKAP